MIATVVAHSTTPQGKPLDISRPAGIVRRFKGANASAMSANLVCFPISEPIGASGFVDTINLHRCGLIEINGWSSDLSHESSIDAAVWVGEHQVACCGNSRSRRPDVAVALRCTDGQAFFGFHYRYWVNPREHDFVRVLEVEVKNVGRWRFEPEFPLKDSGFASLFLETSVMRKSHFFGVGNPNDEVSDEIFDLAVNLPEPLLDVGCGSGALVRRLRKNGRAAFGLELSEGRGGPPVGADVAAHVSRYDGVGSLPYEDKAFPSVICSEVLEHTRAPERFVAEISRVCSSHALFTVPDVGALPLTMSHLVAPRHLLERTHWWGFTETSLRGLLARHFARCQLFRLGRIELNGAVYFETLAVIAER